MTNQDLYELEKIISKQIKTPKKFKIKNILKGNNIYENYAKINLDNTISLHFISYFSPYQTHNLALKNNHLTLDYIDQNYNQEHNLIFQYVPEEDYILNSEFINSKETNKLVNLEKDIQFYKNWINFYNQLSSELTFLGLTFPITKSKSFIKKVDHTRYIFDLKFEGNLHNTIHVHFLFENKLEDQKYSYILQKDTKLIENFRFYDKNTFNEKIKILNPNLSNLLKELNHK